MDPAESNLALDQCPHCGCRDLFIRKDFPQKVGLLIVVVAAISFLVLGASRRHFYLGASVLLVAAIVDAVLYAIVPRITVCYRCRAQFRDRPINPEQHGFEVAIGETYGKP